MASEEELSERSEKLLDLTNRAFETERLKNSTEAQDPSYNPDIPLTDPDETLIRLAPHLDSRAPYFLKSSPK